MWLQAVRGESPASKERFSAQAVDIIDEQVMSKGMSVHCTISFGYHPTPTGPGLSGEIPAPRPPGKSL
jgi:hypothetical protein